MESQAPQQDSPPQAQPPSSPAGQAQPEAAREAAPSPEPVQAQAAAAASSPAEAAPPDLAAAEVKKAVVECLIFVSEKPISAGKLAEIANDSVAEAGLSAAARLDAREVRAIVEQLRREYDAQGRAFQIEEIAEGYRMFTRPEYHPWVKTLAADRQQAKLSPAAVETLAIVAYKQPVTRAHVEDIRGVQAGPLLHALLEKRLVKVVGRENVPGRPLLYGTTREFLDHFGLKDLKDLPTVKDLPRPR